MRIIEQKPVVRQKNISTKMLPWLEDRHWNAFGIEWAGQNQLVVIKKHSRALLWIPLIS